MRSLTLIVLYLAVILSPLVLAALSGYPPRSFFDELASGAGLLAFAIILVEFILSGRFRIVSRRVGMDVTMRFHQLLARAALVLALVHPFLYRVPFAHARPWDPMRQLTLSMDFGAIASGAAAWVLLPVFIVLSIGRDRLPYSYEAWRLMHGLGAVLIAGLVLDHTLSAGRYGQDPALARLWWTMFGAALVSLAYVYLARPLLQHARPWTVASVRSIAMNTWELTLEPDGHGGLRYQAGQFAWLKVGPSALSRRENPFSISSAPGSGNALQFVIKELGDFTGSLDKLQSGTPAFVDGPYGNLVITGRTEPGIALIAGGVGVAPLLGILRQLQIDGDPRPTALVYGNRLKDKIVYPGELDRMARDHGTQIVNVLSEPPAGWAGKTGVMGPDLIRSIFNTPERKEWLYVLCGPPPMMTSVEDTLIGMDVPAHRILSENFKYD